MRIRLLLILLLALGVASAQTATIPDALIDWQEWVLRDLPEQRCPMLRPHMAPDSAAWACAWPHRLDIEVDESGARFQGGATLYAEDWLPLPGNANQWPSEVRVDGREVAVVERSGQPVLRLSEGSHRFEGRIDWPRRPAWLMLPDIYGLVALTVDGGLRVEAERNAQRIRLGVVAEREPNIVPDSLQLDVFRLLSDGMPMILETRVRLVVSGSTRQLDLGQVLPVDVQALQLSSDLDVGLHREHGLSVLLRPGTHWIKIDARAQDPLPDLGAISAAAPWPESELWSFKPDTSLRVLEVNAAQPVDPAQEDVPTEWRTLPTWRLSGDEALSLQLRSRGLADTNERRLSLQRDIWLDFSGDDLHVRDHIAGRLGADGRLQLLPEWTLLRAELSGEPLPVSAAADGGQGLELRELDINLLASSHTALKHSLSVTGWQQDFEQINARLHLPPGHVLISAPGADRAADTWLARWNLLDLFLVLLTSMLTGRLLGRVSGVLALVLFGLTYPEHPTLLFASAALVILQLMRNAVTASTGLQRFLAVLRNAAALVLIVVALPFIASQLRLALHPQLEMYRVTVAGQAPSSSASMSEEMELAVRAEPPRPSPRQRPMQSSASGPQESAAMLDRIEVTSSRIKRTDIEAALPVTRIERAVAPSRGVSYFSGPSATDETEGTSVSLRALAGLGEPDWQWRVHHLSWNGPVLPEQKVNLLILPRWLGSLLRVFSVVLLALLLVRWAQRSFAPRATVAGPSASAAALLLLVAAGLPLQSVQAQSPATLLPDRDKLIDLRDWLLRPPQCVPNCLDTSAVLLDVQESSATLVMEVHVVEASALALPSFNPGWLPDRIRVNGEPQSALLGAEGHSRLWLPRGVHQVEIEARLGVSRQLSLRFLHAVRNIEVQLSEHWTASGLRDDQLLANTLELRRRSPDNADADDEDQQPTLSYEGIDALPFFRIERRLSLLNEWRLQTTVSRIAPPRGSTRLAVPLWPGEHPLNDRLNVRDGEVLLEFAAAEMEIRWDSRIDVTEKLEINAGDLQRQAEVWYVASSPLWRFTASGVPISELRDPGAVQQYRPLPGETLVLDVQPVSALEGPWLAIDQVRIDVALAQRASDYTLTAQLRATQAGQHALALPEGVEVLELSVGQREFNLRPEDGVLRLPISPGVQTLRLKWRDVQGVSPHWRSRMPDLGVASANIAIQLDVPDERWVLKTRGPLLGPAVLYWGELAVMLLIALALSRTGRTPLRFHHWLLLGVGFSTLSWTALVVVVAWLLAVDWRERHGAGLNRANRNLLQLVLGLFTLIAVCVLIGIIPSGLLGRPDMHLLGNGSSPTLMNWFADRSDGLLQDVSVYSLPLWFYRLVILLWAVWLAAALIGWLRWTWRAMGEGGYWQRAPEKAVTAVAPVPDNAEK